LLAVQAALAVGVVNHNAWVPGKRSATSSPVVQLVRAADGSPRRLLAFADESIRRVDAATSVYVLAAAVLTQGQCEPIREILRPLVRKGQGQLHWRDEDRSRREVISKYLADADMSSLVVLGAMMSPRKQERARRRLLGRLLYELDQRQVSHLILESRQTERDRHDVRAVGAFRNARQLSRRLVVSHGLPAQEPLLWVPDAVAGAVGDHRCGEPTYLDMLGASVAVIDVGRAC
jgi:hypothetical protein